MFLQQKEVVLIRDGAPVSDNEAWKLCPILMLLKTCDWYVYLVNCSFPNKYIYIKEKIMQKIEGLVGAHHHIHTLISYTLKM